MSIEPDATSRQGEHAGSLRIHRASDGYEFVYRLWSPVGALPHGRILALHGIQSHGGWYEASCRQLAEAGFEVWFPDRRGSGRNQQNRGDVTAVERWFDDLDELIDLMSQRDGRPSDREPVPLYLLGLSWGAKLAVAHAVVRPHHWQGLILLYPGIHTRVRVKGWQRLAIDLLYGLGFKRTKISIPLGDPKLFTRCREAQQMIEHDHFALHQVTISFLHATGRLDRLAGEGPSHLQLPLFCQLAGDDEIVDNAATRTFLSQFTRCGLTVQEYPAARHTLEFEPNREQITGDLIQWLEGLALRNR
ncbi:MAG: alpha/beta fold hydrolase [Planctomycetota bacterium]|nr:alpha/beta fold hydrolase [Planctomycetota bacterium]MDA1212700.1 alpha/beta fold hydrolase [Planctomycetota bacterium]